MDDNTFDTGFVSEVHERNGKMYEWLTLFTRIGDVIQNPTLEQPKEALAELFTSNDEEHPDAWVECGSRAGPLDTISVYSSGYAILGQYAAVDMLRELESRKIQNLDKDSALELWTKLIQGRLDEIRWPNIREEQ